MSLEIYDPHLQNFFNAIKLFPESSERQNKPVFPVPVPARDTESSSKAQLPRGQVSPKYDAWLPINFVLHPIISSSYSSVSPHSDTA